MTAPQGYAYVPLRAVGEIGATKEHEQGKEIHGLLANYLKADTFMDVGCPSVTDYLASPVTLSVQQVQLLSLGLLPLRLPL